MLFSASSGGEFFAICITVAASSPLSEVIRRSTFSSLGYSSAGVIGFLRAITRPALSGGTAEFSVLAFLYQSERGVRESFMAANTAVRNVFVYGSLLAPEVLTALLHRVPRASLAVVQDYHRYSIKDRIYPAVLPKKGDNVFGKVLFDLSDQELHILDEFEDVEYFKSLVSPLTLKVHDIHGEPVDITIKDEAQEMIGIGCLERVSNALTVPDDQTDKVGLEDNTVEISPGRFVGLNLATEVAAYIYVWVNEGDPNLVGNWDYEVWRANHLKSFLAKYTGMDEDLFGGLREDV